MTKVFWWRCDKCGAQWSRSSVDTGEVICPKCEAAPVGEPEVADGLIWYNDPRSATRELTR
jgi:uncharacterized Zn finger protein (UPF0148 family)